MIIFLGHLEWDAPLSLLVRSDFAWLGVISNKIRVLDALEHYPVNRDVIMYYW